MIDRKALVSRHNPRLMRIDTESPLSVGNGELAFTADVTGLQSLYQEYQALPLCTMSQWGFHSKPADTGAFFTYEDVVMTEYEYNGRRFRYPSECRPGNEAIYKWRRQNPHRLNLARLALTWDGEPINVASLSDIRQELFLYSGLLESRFRLDAFPIHVRTVCAGDADTLGFAIEAPEEVRDRLALVLAFPYGSHKKSASDWSSEERHTTHMKEAGDGFLFARHLDRDSYYVLLKGATATRTGRHSFVLAASGGFSLSFAPVPPPRPLSFDEVLRSSRIHWQDFWEKGGAVDFAAAKDARAGELERRVVLSQYLCAINSAGSLPPQETGLTCNSWYGKFHLEMHILHGAWLPLWNHAPLLERSLGWYASILDEAKKNAARNGFGGARWPKMTGPEGQDSPSRIACLLIWQQPHIIYMLELLRRALPQRQRGGFIRRHFEIISETADFICAFAQEDGRGVFHLYPPLIPAQEEHEPQISLDPAFELSYFRFGLMIACHWARRLGVEHGRWQRVYRRLAPLPESGGLYIAHANCPDTFARFNRDHPSMLFSHGFIPGGRFSPATMNATADAVLRYWDWQTAWGWDFALVAMCLARLGRPDEAVDVLLMDTAKNSYVTSGHNFQRGRDDLPLYLPGNGSLLFALALMLSGYGGTGDMPGFPANGQWEIVTEGISPLPY